MPRIEITLSKIKHNARILCEFYGEQGISLMGVSKAVLGEPLIAEAMIRGGVKLIADSRLENIQRMKNARITAQFVLLRTAPSQAESIVENIDISLNTEIEILEKLNYYASLQNKIHQTSISGLSCDRDLEILGASSDHLILNCKNSDLKVGNAVNFNLDYGSLLTAMTSSFIKKQFIK